MNTLKQDVMEIVNSITEEVYESPSGDLYLITEKDLYGHTYLSVIENSNLHITNEIFNIIARQWDKKLYLLKKEDYETLIRIWQ